MRRTTREIRSSPIREWREGERPREALIALGPESLSSARLLSIIIRTGTRGINAVELSLRLLNAFAGLRGLERAATSEIQRVGGIGGAKAAQIKAALEIGKRLCREKAAQKIESDRQALDYVASCYGPSLRDAETELLYVVMLDKRHRPMRAIELFRGGREAVFAAPDEVLREAILASASSLLLVHNHPSGRDIPSPDDLAFTRTVCEMCSIFGIRVLDHVIVGPERRACFSLARHGLL